MTAMPRKGAGHTGQPSRNPGGRGSEYPGEKKITTYYLTTDARETAKRLAEMAGKSQNVFVETLIRRKGPDLAAELALEQKNAKAEDADRGGDHVAAGSADAVDLPAD